MEIFQVEHEKLVTYIDRVSNFLCFTKIPFGLLMEIWQLLSL